MIKFVRRAKRQQQSREITRNSPRKSHYQARVWSWRDTPTNAQFVSTARNSGRRMNPQRPGHFARNPTSGRRMALNTAKSEEKKSSAATSECDSSDRCKIKSLVRLLREYGIFPSSHASQPTNKPTISPPPDGFCPGIHRGKSATINVGLTWTGMVNLPRHVSTFGRGKMSTRRTLAYSRLCKGSVLNICCESTRKTFLTVFSDHHFSPRLRDVCSVSTGG